MTLAPVWRLGDLELTEAPYLVAFGTSYGEPENVTDILRSLLTDGDLEVTPRRGNRTVTLPILIEGADLAALGEAEAALWAEVDRARNELYCDPGDGFAAPFVLDVFRGSMVFNRDDEYEKAGYRSYTLTFRALPWPHADVETTVAALSAAASPTTVNVDDGSSTTGWTGSANSGSVTVTTASGAVKVQTTTAQAGGGHLVRAIRSGTVDTSATKYIVTDWTYGEAGVSLGGGANPLTLTSGATTYFAVSSAPSPTAGYTRSVFYIPDASLAGMTFALTTSATSAVRSLTIDNIDRTDAPPVTSVRQLLRSLEVDGSAPTTGSIAVEHATSALGDVILYTCPDDGSAYTPACRAYRSSGGTLTSPDSTAASGASETLSGAVTIDRPNSSLPSGTYLVMARMKRSSAATATITWTVRQRMNSTDIGSLESHSTSVALTTSFAFVRLGITQLPLMDTASSSSAVTRITVAGSSSETLDELYLFNIETGRLTQVACGTGTAAAGSHSNRLWIDSPSLDNEGLGRYLRGYAADQSDAFSAYPYMEAPGVHEFEPPSVKVFTVTTNPTTAADVSFTYKAAWHTHAAA